MQLSWSLDHLLGYLGTWSPRKRFLAERGQDALEIALPGLRAAWGDAGERAPSTGRCPCARSGSCTTPSFGPAAPNSCAPRWRSWKLPACWRERADAVAWSMFTFVTGGLRSGKSEYALRRASELGPPPWLYVAPHIEGDDELKARLARHRRDQEAAWHLLEAPAKTRRGA